MLVAGIDIGSMYAKAVIMNSDSKILSVGILRSGASNQSADAVMAEALKMARLKIGDIDYVVSTGYGRKNVPFSNTEVTEITCHARGAGFLFPDVRTIIDIGGQDSKVISVIEGAQVKDFVMNDKCAAGTGRFLEVMASTLDVATDKMNELAFSSHKQVEVSSMCTVFAESEVISLIANGWHRTDIAAGLFRAIANRVAGMVARVGLKEKVAATGGAAYNTALVKALEEKLSTTILVPENPQITGALGAALIAIDLILKNKESNDEK